MADWWSMSRAEASGKAHGPVVGLLLAGGRGSRFDASGKSDKLLASYEGEPVIVRSARTLTQACSRVFAVLPPGKSGLRGLLEQAGCETVVTEATRLGMGHSIAQGVAQILERCTPHCLVLALGDMPRLASTTVLKLIEAAGSDPRAIIAPSLHGKRGHPVVFGADHLQALTRLSGDRGAFAILEQHQPRLIEVDDPGVLHDIDTPADLLVDPFHDSMDRRRDTPDTHGAREGSR